MTRPRAAGPPRATESPIWVHSGPLAMVKKLGILGLGLMGGSLGLAAKRRGLATCVTGFARREEIRKRALEMHAVDMVFAQPEDAVADADLTVLCVPVLAMSELVRRCAPYFPARGVITDVGSTKARLVEEMRAVLAGSPAVFVGSHPIAGSERSGIEAARADLYERSVVVVTPAADTPCWAQDRVSEFWTRLNCSVRISDPGEHDRIIALTSHLPHLVAATLVVAVYGEAGDAADFCGGGFRDTTRVAAGSEDVWHDIVKSNQPAVMAALERYGELFERVRGLIAGNDFEGLRRFLAEARVQRQAVVAALEKRKNERGRLQD